MPPGFRSVDTFFTQRAYVSLSGDADSKTPPVMMQSNCLGSRGASGASFSTLMKKASLTASRSLLSIAGAPLQSQINSYNNELNN